MKTITIFEKFVKVKEQISLEEMLNRIKLCIYSQWIKPLRRMLNDGNSEAYDAAKRLLDAFTPSGKFMGGRKRELMVDYIRPEIRIRRPYGRNSENLPRRASFIASVNFEQVLTDPSGSRRYLCSKVESLDYQHIVDIDGAMAQAYALYKSKFKFWFDQEEIKDLTNRNEDFMSKSVEEELIETWLRPVTMEEWKTKNQFVNGQNIQLMTATQIATKIMEKARIILLDNTIVKIGKILKKNGFERIRKGNNYSYMLRIVEAETVEMGCRTLEDTEALAAEIESNNQIIRLEEDLFGTGKQDDLPF